MAPPFFAGISRDVNGLLNADFYHNTSLNLDLSTTATNGVKFNIKGKQPTADAPLSVNLETKYNDKATGLNLTQSWNNSNNLITKLEISDILTKGVKTELQTNLVPSVSKNAKINLSFVQPFFAVKGSFDLLKNPSFLGDFTVSHDNIIAGTEFNYDITQGTLNRYALALAYTSNEYTLACSTNNKFLTTVSFFQKVSPILQVGAKATHTSTSPSTTSTTESTTATTTKNPVNIEFATKYTPDPNSQIKAKLADNGSLALAYKQILRPGITLGLGASFNVLKINDPVHKVGASLSFVQ